MTYTVYDQIQVVVTDDQSKVPNVVQQTASIIIVNGIITKNRWGTIDERTPAP